MSTVTYGDAARGEKPIHHWTSDIEKPAWDQLKKLAAIPDVFHHVAVMPDAHAGKGCTVGTVVATQHTLIPSLVGVDIGCGMSAASLGLKSGDLGDGVVSEIRSAIENTIPVGKESFTEPRDRLGRWPKWAQFVNLRGVDIKDLAIAQRQIGTLGGGNHFIELSEDEGYNLWVVIHTGSRGIGHRLATYHMETAKRLKHNESLSDPDFASFLSGTSEMAAYRECLEWAQAYAAWNRENMMEMLNDVFTSFFPSLRWRRVVDCHHNYVAWERHFEEHVYVTRKGAIRAQAGDLGIIPGSMGTSTYIVRGKGNPASFNSASHGAGRKMSRTAAREKYTLAALAEATKGVDCRKDEGVLDEIPLAYKPIDVVMRQQGDLVSVVAKLKALLCVKG